MAGETKPAEDAAVFDERVLAYLAEAQTRPLPVSGVDAQGRILPLTPEEEIARMERFDRMMEELRAVPDDDPPDALEQVMRGIDENRPPGQKLFEGMY